MADDHQWRSPSRRRPRGGSGRSGLGRAVAVMAVLTAAAAVSLSPVDGEGQDSASAATVAPRVTSGRTPSWAAQFMEGSKPRSREQAVAEARRYHVIAAQPETYAAHVDAMKRERPNLTLLAYTNGTFTSRTNLPNSWYALDRNGNRIYSRGWPGNKLLNPMSTEAQNWVIDQVKTRLRASGYDGAFIDTMGIAPTIPGYASARPVDPRTGLPWTRDAWLKNRTAFAARIQSAIGSRPMVCNGLTAGGVYFSASGASKQLYRSGMQYGMAEVWLREPQEPLTHFKPADSWRQDVDMLVDAGKMGRGVAVTVKAWAPGTERQRNRYYRYALASFLLGSDGRSVFNFSDQKNRMTSRHALDRLNLGSPWRQYVKRDGVYRRPFDRGLVLVNPTGTSRTVTLARPFMTLSGERVRRVMVGEHQGVFLLRD